MTSNVVGRNVHGVVYQCLIVWDNFVFIGHIFQLGANDRPLSGGPENTRRPQFLLSVEIPSNIISQWDTVVIILGLLPLWLYFIIFMTIICL